MADNTDEPPERPSVGLGGPLPNWSTIAAGMHKNLAENPTFGRSLGGFSPVAGPLGRVTGRQGGQLERPSELERLIVLDIDETLAPWWRRPFVALARRFDERFGFWEFVERKHSTWTFGKHGREYGVQFHHNESDASLRVSVGHRVWRWEWRVWHTSDRR